MVTKTRNLQDQIFSRDLPRIAEFFQIRFVLLKGRENMICSRRLEEAALEDTLLSREPYFRALKYLKHFNEKHQTGDIEEALRFLRRYGNDGRRALEDVRATDDTCTPDHRYQCRHYQTIAAARRADVIVANHHLALLWPDYYPEVSRIVIDEAHSFEDAATDVLGLSFSPFFVTKRLRRLWNPRRRRLSLLGRVPDGMFRNDEGVAEILDAVESVRRAVDEWRAQAESFAGAFGGGRVWIREEILSSQNYDALREESLSLADRLGTLTRLLRRTAREWRTLPRLEDIAERMGRTADGFEALETEIEALFKTDPSEETVFWYESGSRSPTFHRSPLHPGRLLRDNFYPRFKSVLFTSATLQTGGNFDYLLKRLGLAGEEPYLSEGEAAPFPRVALAVSEPVAVGHPFRYEEAALIGIYSDNEGARDPVNLAERIDRLATIRKGRLLALFTNKERMLETAEILDELSGGRYRVLSQYRDGGRHFLARKLRHDPGIVLLGSRSFWEGIDIPGEALEIVVLEKIPFRAPGDPLYDARCEALGDRWFREYALPEALLTLRQGFGRLIRTERDRGAVALLDPGKRSYLAAIRASLPPCRTIIGSEEEILEAMRLFFHGV
ncbi:MAG: hypothetical protein D6679_04790 [Candidatus Hydrogenedentota bacterium]|nr:MAG: hypothetical protein D6679_04790 [Candidatus Hydrogenedentota bacterium]